MPDDHSKLVPLLPIPNRTVKRLSADDSADSRVKVGHCQALTAAKGPMRKRRAFCLFVSARESPGLFTKLYGASTFRLQSTSTITSVETMQVFE